jgi:hypothetical protein
VCSLPVKCFQSKPTSKPEQCECVDETLNMQFMCLFSFRFYVFDSLPFFPPLLFSDFTTLLILQLCLPPFLFLRHVSFFWSQWTLYIYIYIYI